MEPIKDNEEAVRAYGIHLGTEMCRKILANGIKTLHLYTLNMEKSALAILMVDSHIMLKSHQCCLINLGQCLKLCLTGYTHLDRILD